MANILDEWEKDWQKNTQTLGGGNMLDQWESDAIQGGAISEPTPPPDEGILSNIFKGAKAGVAGTYGGLAGWVGGKNAIQEYLDDVVQSNQRSREHDGYDLDYFLNGSGLAYDVGNLLGSFGAMAPAAFAVPEAAGVAGAGALATGLGRIGLTKAAEWAAKNALTKGGGALGNYIRYGLGSGTLESASEGGSAVTRAVEEGKENPYAIGAEVFAKNWPLLVGSQALEGGILHRGFSRLGGKAGESFKTRAAKALPRTAPYMAGEGLTESAQEVMQERAQEEAFGEPTGGLLPDTWTDAEKKAFYATFAPAALLGGVGGVRGSMRQNPTNRPPERQDYLATWDDSMGKIDSRYSSKWESQPGATDLANLQDSVAARWNGLASEYGGGLTITGGAEKGYHAGGEDGHEGGWKIDVDKNSVKDEAKFLDLARKYGFAVGDEGDHYDLSANPNGKVGGEVKVSHADAGTSGGWTNANAKAIYDVFKAEGYSDEAIAGILGRVQQEHNFETSDVPEYDDEQGRHLGGYGMFQWNGGRTTAFKQWAEENGLDPQNPTVQAQYALIEAKQRGLTPERMNQLSHEDAADVWTDEWEVGEKGDERKYAGEWLNVIKNGGGGSSVNVPSASSVPKVETPTVDTYDDVYEEFVNDYYKDADEDEKSVFDGMLTKDGNFVNNEENRRKIEEDFGEEFEAWKERKGNPSLQTEFQKLIDQSVKDKNVALNQKLMEAKVSGNIQLMQKYVDEAKAKQGKAQPMAKPAFPIVQEGAITNGSTQSTESTQAPPQQAQTGVNQNQYAESRQTEAEEVGRRLQEALNNANLNNWNLSDEDKMELQELQRRLMTLTGQKPADIILPKQEQSGQLILPERKAEAPQAKNGIMQTAEDRIEANAQRAMSSRIQTAIRNHDYDTALELARQSGREELANLIESIPVRPAPRTEGYDTTISKQGNIRPTPEEERRLMELAGQEPAEIILPNQRQAGSLILPEQKQEEQPASRNPGFMQTAEEKAEENAARALQSRVATALRNRDYATASDLLRQQGKDKMADIVDSVPRTSARSNETIIQHQQEPSKKFTKAVAKAVAKFRKEAEKVLQSYADGKTTYEKALSKLETLMQKAYNGAKDSNTQQAVMDEYAKYAMELENIRQQKEVEAPSQTAQESAGEQEATTQIEEPTQEEKPAQSEAEPASNEGGEKSAQNATVEENSTVDDDYHGFLDDKAPGAVAEIRRQLEKKDNSFGTGLLTTKHIVERWAETDEINQSQAKGKTFYLHGNKVSKAVYDYYNHLILDSYINSLDENGEPKQTKQEKPAKKQDDKRIIVATADVNGKTWLDAIMEKYRDGRKSVQDAEMEIKHYRDRWIGMVRGVRNPQKLQELNDSIALAEKYLKELAGKSASNTDEAEARKASKERYKEISAILKRYEKGEKNLIPIEDVMEQVHRSKTLLPEHMKALDERAAKIAEKTAKNAETKQEKPAEAENNTVKAPEQMSEDELEDWLLHANEKDIEQWAKTTHYKKVAQSGSTFIIDTFYNTENGKEFTICVRDYDYDGSRDINVLYEMPIDKDAYKAWQHKHGKIVEGDVVEVVKGRKVPVGTISRVKKIRSVRDKYGRWVADYADLENGQSTNVTNCQRVEEAHEEVTSNEQQAESGSSDGGHGDMEPGGGREDQREGTGEVSGRAGREGTPVRGSDVEEHSEEPQPSGVRAGAELDSAAGNGSNKRGNKSQVPLTEAEAHPSPTETPGHNYEIKDTDLSTKSEKVRFKQNVEAIKMLKQLEADDRMPTPAEQEILAGYNGWGGLKGAFIEGSDMNKEIRELLTEEEYKAARSTINDAFYTPPKLIRAIWEGISHLGFKGGRVLDPSMGVGNFFGTMPRDMMDKSTLRGVELDDLTSRLGKMLYPGAFVEHKGFQKSGVADNYFDLAISNIPFGQSMINGYQVHNFFFANGIDKVRPGGLMVYITSQGSLAGGKDAVRMRNYLAGQADLIAAYKLPSGVFSDSGTQVATDIVIFRKRDKDGKKSPYGQKFADVKEIKRGEGYHAQKLYDINEYFEAHPENILGEQSNGKDQWGNPALNVKMAEGTTLADVANDIESAMKKLPEDVYQPVSRKKSKAFDTASAQKRTAAAEKTRDYEYYYKDGKPVQNQNGQEVSVTGAKAKIVDSYLKLKNTLNALFAAESDPKATNKQVESIRKKLNKDYDAFVAKHGLLTGKAAAAFRDDPSAGMVQALEKPQEETYKDKKGNERKRIVGAEKADIFSVRSIKPVQEVTHVESADDALLASLTNKGDVDLDYMAGLMNSKPEKLVSQLKGKVFKNPVTEDYETREEYLSGNVREKLAQAKEAAKSDQAYADNVKELEKVVPEDLVSDEIYVNLGTPWIPVSDVQDFVNSVSDGLTVKFSRGAALWTVSGYGRSAKYKLQGIRLDELLDHVLNNKAIQIFDGSGDNKVFNKEKTDAANVAAEELQQDFRDWIWKDKEREKRLTRYYNDNYNNTVVRQYNGQHLNLHAYGMNAKITLKPHQKDVVWRMLQGQNTLIAHCVGAGKTFEMQAAGMEMRRLGIANKPMYCLPNNVVQQFAREFRILYPNAKLLVLQSNDLPAVEKTSKLVKTEDGRTKRESLLEGKTTEQKAAIMAKRTARNRMLNRIRTEDWDGIIISHNLFQRFPVTPDTAAAFIQQEIDNLEQTIREARADKSMDTRALSRLEDAKKNLEERLEDAISTDIEDIGVPFEELGVDQLFVDEADMFKNLEFATRLGNIRGLSNSKANRSRDMFIKTQWLTNTLNGRGVVFATGTPVSNTMSELYTMMRYLDMKGLKEKGLELFDNWLRTFGDIGQGIERKPTGDGFRKVTMIKRFINMAELTKMFRKFADVKVQEELNLNIPKLKDGKTTVVALEPDPKVVNYIKNVVPERVKNMKSGFKKEKGEDNMLSLTNDLRKLSLTDSKIDACADAIAKKYHETTDVKGTQLVFCDMGIPKAEKGETALTDKDGEAVAAIENPEVYRKLIEKLKKKGIPEKEVAFIQNYNTKQKRDDVFQKVNKGEVRILIGSTETMGAGTNCQTHLVALHDLDAPWRPRDLEQRHGRILRQGNENEEVEIFNYVVKDSFDANMWEKLKNKAAIIQQAMSGDMNMRTVEDADLVTLSYAEVEGAATGNPLIKEQLQVQNDLTKYQHAQTSYRKKIRDAENLVEGSDEKIAEKKRYIAKIEKDIAERKETKGDKFSMLVGKKGYKERGKADEALQKLLESLTKENPVEIGKIGGFTLKGYYNGVRAQTFLVNNLSYDVKTDSVQGIEYAVQHSPEAELKRAQDDLAYYEKEVEQAKEILKQENPYAAKVKELSDRLNQLNREIADTLVEDGKKAVEAKEEAEEKPSSNRKYSIDGKPIVGVRKYSTAWHGTAAKGIDRLSLKFIGTGEGAQVHGYGLYFAGNRAVSEGYREELSKYLPTIRINGYEVTKKPSGWTALLDAQTGETEFIGKNTIEGAALEAFTEAKGDLGEAEKYLIEKYGEAKKRYIDEAIDFLREENVELLEKPGSLFQVEIPDEDVMLDEQKKFDEQPEKVQKALKDFLNKYAESYHYKKEGDGYAVYDGDRKVDVYDWEEDAQTSVEENNEAIQDSIDSAFRGGIESLTGREIYGGLSRLMHGDKQASEKLNDIGIKGITYIGGRDGRCYVVFDDEAIEIIQRLSVAKGKASKRSMDELKAEVKGAFPGAKVQESGNKLTFTMPNGQKVTVSLQENITVNEQEEAVAKSSHGFDQSASVTIEGYAETVGAEGFIALSQGSREGTGFHEAYHIAEAMAFTKKELADAKRLISESEEERADTYAKWKLERKKGNNFAKLWQKIADVAAKMAGILGYETKRNIFRKVESGEVYKRDNTNNGTSSRQYSLMSDDNSKAGLTRKVKNIFTGKKDSPRYRQRVKELMEEIAGIKIYYGKTDRDFYAPFEKYIRVQKANDWDNMTYYFSHAVCDKLGIAWNDTMGNYVSSWLLTGEATNDSQEAKTFMQAMADNVSIREQLLDLQEAFANWRRMKPSERIGATISYENEEKTTWGKQLNKLYDQFIEELGPVKRLVESIEKRSGVKQSALTNPYSAFRLFRGATGRAMTMIEGNAEAIEGLRRMFPAINWDGFKTIHMILESIGAIKNQQVREDFNKYIIAKHVLDIHSFNHGLEGQIAKLRNEMDAASDQKKKKEIEDKINALEARFMDTPSTEADCRATIAEFDDRFKEAQQDLVHYSDTMLAIIHDSGIISDTRYEKLLKKWPNYVPMFRVFDDNDKTQWGDSLKPVEGSPRDMIEPLQSIIRNTFDMVRRAEKNKCKNLLANLAEMDGAGEVLTRTTKSAPQDGTTIVFYRDGEKCYLQTDPSVVEAVNTMGMDNASMFIRLMRFPASVARAVFTTLNPSFVIRNTIRDVQDAFVYNKHGYVTPLDIVRAFMDFFNGARHAWKKDNVYWEWLASGAAQASAASIDRDYVQSAVDKYTDTKWEAFRKHPVDFSTDWLLKLAEISEYGTRIGAYERVKKTLAKDGKNVTAVELAEAAIESRDLMDFARGGRSSRTWNRLAIFANASLQGWDKFFRTFNLKKRPKEATMALARLTFASLLPALILAMLHRDKDWWKELPDWQKNTNWILGDNIRIPKGQDIGLRVTSALIDKMFDDRPDKLKRGIWEPIKEQLPSLIPTAMLPIGEAYLNKSIFKDAPIVPEYQKNLPAKMQYAPTTSSMAKWLGEKLDISPRKIEHVVYGYGGNLARAGFSAPDYATGTKRMNTAVEEMPIISGVMMTPFKNAQTVTDFYDELQRQREGDKAFKEAHERIEGYNPAKYQRMNAASKKMSELNKKERKLLDDNRISPARKQELQAGIQRQRIAIAKRAMGVK